MQVVPAQFLAHATADVRPLAWRFKVSFDKAFDAGVTFFTLNQSLLNGPDILKPTGADVIQEWDKYAYDDYSDDVISMEWTREFSYLSSITAAYADILMVLQRKRLIA